MIGKNFLSVKEKIEAAFVAQGCPERLITVCAASKTRSFSDITEAVRAGITVFGENYVQEAEEKLAGEPWTVLKQHYHLKMRLIGHLQSNKVARAVRLFDSIDSVDSLKLAQKINQAATAKKPFEILLQYNPMAQESKDGLTSKDEVMALTRSALAMDNLLLRGLMVVTPPGAAEPAFARAQQLFNKMKELSSSITTLSMGMSGDYELALRYGSTMIRPGTVLFGER